jgi:hypothetical protein
MSLAEFLTAAEKDPVQTLGMQPLVGFLRQGNRLEPGEVLHAYPPFFTKEAAKGVSLNAVPVFQAIQYLSELARQVASMRSGEPFRITAIGRK